MKAILESRFIVPAECVPLNALREFQKTIPAKDKEAEDINLDFFEYDSATNTYSFCRGNLPLLRKFFAHMEWEDLRAIVPMGSNNIICGSNRGITFTGQPRDNQIPVINAVLENPEPGFGQISAPPRFGKTVVMTYLTCAIKQRTLFLSHSIDLAKQAMMTFYDRTNVMEMESQEGRQFIGLVEDWEDLDKYDVCFMAYQRFVSGTDADIMLSKYKNRFGVVMVDECHKSSAPEYSRVVNSFNSKYRMGVSGTVERKDKTHVVNDYILGPVIATGVAPQLPCDVHVVNTKTTINVKAKGNFFWAMAKSQLAKNHRRNQILLNDIRNWAHAGHSIIAVTETRDHINLLVDSLKKDGFKAEAYHAKAFKNDTERERILNRMRTGESQIMVAIRQMVLGLDIPRLTAFFNLMPSANAPNYYQELSRIRTPFEGKERAYIIDYFDDHYLLKATLKTRIKEYNRLDLDIVRDDLSVETLGSKSAFLS